MEVVEVAEQMTLLVQQLNEKVKVIPSLLFPGYISNNLKTMMFFTIYIGNRYICLHFKKLQSERIPPMKLLGSGQVPLN